jgi:hypothetical protein
MPLIFPFFLKLDGGFSSVMNWRSFSSISAHACWEGAMKKIEEKEIIKMVLTKIAFITGLYPIFFSWASHIGDALLFKPIWGRLPNFQD